MDNPVLRKRTGLAEVMGYHENINDIHLPIVIEVESWIVRRVGKYRMRNDDGDIRDIDDAVLV